MTSNDSGCCGAQPKSHEGHHTHSDHDEDRVTCLALVKETGSEISLFDAKGEVQSFAFKGDVHKLCFSSHGQDADDLLTPCFDEDGNHGTPDEGCFCGLDEPHLHAHIHDAKTCDDNRPKNGNLEAELLSLARLTLRAVPPPVDAKNNDADNNETKELFKVQESESMPTQCNSHDYTRHMSGTDSDSKPPRMKRMHKVQHNDHFDFLVHNKTTGDLHLEHPCDSCGDNDFHGKFRFVGKRKWNSGSDDVHLHFFQRSERQFSLRHLFEPESGRVSAIRPEAPCCKKRSSQKGACCLAGACDSSTCCTEDTCCSSEKLTSPDDCCAKVKASSGCCSKSTGPGGTIKSNDCSSDGSSMKPCCADKSCASVGNEGESCCVGKDCESIEKEGEPCCAGNSCASTANEAKSCCASKSTADDPEPCCAGKSCASTVSEGETCCAGKSCESTTKTESCCAGSTEKSCASMATEGDSCCAGKSCAPAANEGEGCCAGASVAEEGGSFCATKCCTSTLGEAKSGCASTNGCDPGLIPAELPGGPRIVRSSLICTQICCSSEVPAIEKILKPMSGVERIMINPTLRSVTVDHDIDKVTVSDIEKVLNDNRFGATIQRDGGMELDDKHGRGRSKFYVEKICCASEIPAIRKIVEPLDGVSDVMINVTTKTVYVEHDFGVIQASDICDALNNELFGASVQQDAALTSKAASAFVTSIFSFDSNECDPDTRDKVTNFLGTFQKTQIETSVFDLPNGNISIVHNPLLLSTQDIVNALSEKTVFEVEVVTDGKDTIVWEFPDLPEEEEAIQPESAKLRPTVLLSGILWVISMLSFIGGNWEYLKYLALFSVAFGLPPIAVKACLTMRRFQFDTNCLMFFASAGAVALQEYTEAAAVTFLFALSEWLEVRATARARNALSAIVQLRPESANLIHPQSGEIVVVPARAVPEGALVIVRTGDRIPCDGIVIEGQSTVDESSLTGESRPVRKAVNDAVSGGTINSGNAQLMVRTTASADDSAVARLIRLVEEAQANRSETEKLVDEFARIYTPIVVLSALFMCTVPWAWGRDIGRQWTHNGLVLIVVACPCALIISTPVAYVAGLAATAQRGVLVKGGAHLEALGLVKHICFDKTGTLTQGKFQMLHLSMIGEAKSRTEVLALLSLVEERASHPLAQALVDAARREGANPPRGLYVKDHTILPGEGISGVVDGVKVHVGNKRLFERIGLYADLSAAEKSKAQDWEAAGGTVGFMSIGDEGIVCAYCVADAVRPEALEVLKKFDCMGIDATMLTGDNADAAEAMGKLVGLHGVNIRSQLLPEDKLSIVSEMKDGREGSRSGLAGLCSTRRLVLMCGDGVNDAPALAIADVGVAMGEGAALAMETADVTLLESRLEKLVYAIEMGKRVLRKIKENVVFSIGVKLLVLGFALAGKASLWGAIATDVGAMLIVTLNGMYLLPSKREQKANMHLDSGGDIEKGG